MTDNETAVYAPQHRRTIIELGEAYVIEDVLYSAIKCTYLCNYDDSVRVYCETCDWETTVGELPEDSGTVQPDMCPACVKRGEIGWVRSTPLNARPEPDDVG